MQQNCLIVEDNPRWQKLLAGNLSRLGFECTIVSDEEQAIDAIQKSVNEHCLFSLITLDCHLDGTGRRAGREILVYLRDVFMILPEVSCIVVSGTSEPDEVRDFLVEFSVEDFFSKQRFELDRFIKLVSEIRDRKTSSLGHTQLSLSQLV
jgi:CheY-like chemotaxis protein